MSEILRRIDELSESLDVYQKHLSTLNPEELILFYETVDSNSKSAWKLKAAIIAEFHKKAEKVGDAVEEIIKAFGISKSQVYAEIKIFNTFLKDPEEEYNIAEKSWYTVACEAPDPVAALGWVQGERDSGNNEISVRDFKAYVSSQKDSETGRRVSKNKKLMRIFDKSGAMRLLNVWFLVPMGLELAIYYTDLEKKDPRNLYLKDVNPTAHDYEWVSVEEMDASINSHRVIIDKLKRE